MYLNLREPVKLEEPAIPEDGSWDGTRTSKYEHKLSERGRCQLSSLKWKKCQPPILGPGAGSSRGTLIALTVIAECCICISRCPLLSICSHLIIISVSFSRFHGNQKIASRWIQYPFASRPPVQSGWHIFKWNCKQYNKTSCLAWWYRCCTTREAWRWGAVTFTYSFLTLCLMLSFKNSQCMCVSSWLMAPSTCTYLGLTTHRITHKPPCTTPRHKHRLPSTLLPRVTVC